MRLRSWAAAWLGGFAFAGGTALARWTWSLEVVRLRVSPPGFPPEWDGIRVAHLSDFHAGARGVPLRLLRSARAAALSFAPDIIALTGDFFDNGVPVDVEGLWAGWPEDTVVVAVLGNHDFRGASDAPAGIERVLRDAGVVVLRNAALEVQLHGRRGWIVGVDDPFTLQADEVAAFAEALEDDAVLLYLAHSPSIDATVPFGRAFVALSGHTHAGQIRLLPSGRIPFVHVLRRLRGTPPRRDPPVYRGVHWLRGMIVIISEGIGVSRVPLRFRTRPQVVLIEFAHDQRSDVPCDNPRRYVTHVGRERGLADVVQRFLEAAHRPTERH